MAFYIYFFSLSPFLYLLSLSLFPLPLSILLPLFLLPLSLSPISSVSVSHFLLSLLILLSASFLFLPLFLPFFSYFSNPSLLFLSSFSLISPFLQFSSFTLIPFLIFSPFSSPSFISSFLLPPPVYRRYDLTVCIFYPSPFSLSPCLHSSFPSFLLSFTLFLYCLYDLSVCIFYHHSPSTPEQYTSHQASPSLVCVCLPFRTPLIKHLAVPLWPCTPHALSRPNNKGQAMTSLQQKYVSQQRGGHDNEYLVGILLVTVINALVHVFDKTCEAFWDISSCSFKTCF